MKTLLILIAALGLTACQVKSNPEPVKPSTPALTTDVQVMEVQAKTPQEPAKPGASVTLMDDTLKGCYAKIDELKHFDRKRANTFYAALSKTIKARTETNASAEHISPEALSYALYHYNQNVGLICTQVSQKLDKLILAAVMKNSA